MAISEDGKRGQIGPSLRGLIYQYERDGRWVTSKWPKPRKNQLTERQRLSMETFKSAMLAMKMTAAPIQSFHRAMAKGTPMLPRDSLMAALYGNGPTINFYNGKVVKPMANKLMASTVLDAISDEPGAALFRGAETWEAATGGRPGQILISGGPDAPAYWGTGGAAGVGQTYVLNTPASNSTSGKCLKANIYQPVDGLTIAAVYIASQALAGDVQSLDIALLDATNVITAIPRSIPVAVTGNGVDRLVRVDIDPPLRINDGQKFALIIMTTGKAPNFITRIKNGGYNGLNWPFEPNFGYSTMVKNSIDIGHSLSVVPGEIFQLGMRVY